jgi:deazaflavin-dependent oxidoreductase (nitroreductase family)
MPNLVDRSWPVLRRLMGGHTGVYRATGGLIGHTIPGALPTLLLDHVGAKSGTKRTSPLSYLADGDSYVIVASKGGYPKNPAWFYNLKANPDTTVQVRRRKVPVRARVATDEEHDRLWPLAVAGYKGYAGYQERTDRKIPMVILEPR